MGKTNIIKDQPFRLLPFLLLTILLWNGCKEEKKEEVPVATAPSIATFYLIRHAEKDRSDPSDSNPELNQAGLGRAIKWEEILQNVPLTAIYSTNFERTLMTAEPAAVKNNISVQYYDPSTLDIPTFLKDNENGHVLVVGHSNTTPVLANSLLGEEKYAQIDDNDNASLFIIRVIDSVATSIRLHID